jgi:hypothetical protein
MKEPQELLEQTTSPAGASPVACAKGLFYPDAWCVEQMVMDLTATNQEVGPKVMSLTALTGRVFFGLCLSELEDSFIMVNPCVFMSNGEDIKAENTSKQPVVRMLKTAFMMVSNADPVHRFYFLNHLTTQFQRLPGFFTKEVRAGIEGLVQEMKGNGMTTSLRQLVEMDPEFSGKSVKEQMAAQKAGQSSAAQAEDDFEGPFQTITPFVSKLKH